MRKQMLTASWFKGKEVLVLGLAKSGYAAAKLLNQLGATVIINDAKDLNGSEEEQELNKWGIKLVSGSHPDSLIHKELDYVVKNPGIRYDNPLVKGAIENGIPVVTEIELAGMMCQGDILAISGSNGKTTTTMLIYEMLHNSDQKAHIAGNIGKVACEVSQKVKKGEVMVTEVSSFQLKGTEYFHPKTAVLLNIFDAHLDYHGGREDYERSKGKLFANMEKEDKVVYNADDPVVTELAEQSKATLIPFSISKVLREGAYLKDDKFYFRDKEILPVKEATLPGKHNQENMLAAIAAAMIHGAEIRTVREVLRTFKGMEHRLQFAGHVHGRSVYNDSKATNMLSTQKAIEAFEQPIVLLAGGLDRGNYFDDLIPSFKKISAAVFYGETKKKLQEAANKADVKKVDTVDTLEEAVRAAFQFSSEGDVLLLSPACASWDQFKTFEERGNRFLEVVEELRRH